MSLPELIRLNAYGGDWNLYVNEIYNIFLSEIVKANLSFLGWPISCKWTPATDNKHFSFWHLVSEGKTEEERLPDLKRCERIRWIPYILRIADDKERIKCWENKRGNNKHIVLWLKSYDYAVILARRQSYFLLKTAYVIDQEHRKRKFEREREEFPDPRND